MPKDTELHKCAYKGDRGGIVEALSSGINVNAPGAANRSAIHRAVGGGHREIVELLIEKGAQTNYQDKSGRSPQVLVL